MIYQTHEQHLAERRAAYAANRDERRATAQAWRDNNKAKIRTKNRRQQSLNKQARALLKTLLAFVTPEAA